MNILADENIAFAEEAFSSLGKVVLLPGRSINNSSLKNTDILLVRSVTRVDRSLLEDTPVKFVGTATIGTDHIDLNYLEDKNIRFTDAKGCNADAVAEYVFTALYYTAAQKGISLRNKSIGIIGAGNIGSRVARIAGAAGMNVLLNDPPLKRITGSSKFLELNQVMDADIITLHVPLLLAGQDKTYHLLDESNLKRLKHNGILINTSRGEVISSRGLYDLREQLTVILDVWENEPGINTDLLSKVYLGTPHIAGYSLEGKVNGTLMIYRALCTFLGLKPEWLPVYPAISDSTIKVSKADTEEKLISSVLSSIYDIKEDDRKLKETFLREEKNTAQYFDQLRRDYPLRREFSNYTASGNISSEIALILQELRFKIS